MVEQYGDYVPFMRPEEFATDSSSMAKVLKQLTERYVVVITMPNADTLGSIYRKELQDLEQALPDKIVTVESFGES